MKKDNLYLLDGHAVIFRSYYAYIKNPLRNAHGENTSAIFGFFQIIRKLFKIYQPTQFAIAFDPIGPSFRKDIYKEYKANREKAPEDLLYQMPIIMDIVKALEIPMICIDKYEADDILATIAHSRDTQKQNTCIISSDKDLLQTLTAHTHILRQVSKGTEWEDVSPQWLEEHWQLEPYQIQDYLALVGDTSDNIPGVLGVGEKTALALLHEHKNLNEIYKNIDSIKPSWQKKLIENKENAFLSYKLVELEKNVKIPDISFSCPSIAWEKAAHLFAEQSISTFNKKSDFEKNPNTTTTAKSASTKTEKEPVKNTPAQTPNTYGQSSYFTEDKKSKYTLITDIKELNKIVAQGLEKKRISIDLETTSLNTFSADIVGISLSVKPKEAFYIALDAPNQDKKDTLPKNDVKKALSPLFEKNNCMLILHNSKFDLPILSRWGLEKDLKQDRAFFDTLIAAWMCDVTLQNYSMDYLASHILSYKTISYSSLTAIENKQAEQNNLFEKQEAEQQKAKEHNKKFNGLFCDVALEQAVPYACEDADITLRLYEVFEKTMKEKKLNDVFYSLEMPITEILLRMEKKGIGIDITYLKKLSKELNTLQQALEKEIYSLCNKEFNIKSTKQLQEVLFTDLKLKPVKKNQTGFSTDVAVLTQLAGEHPVPKKILEYRHVTKLQNTYTDTLPQQIEPTTSRIHTSFNQNGTETGRLSSTNPNLQNIPTKDKLGQKIRSAFVSAPNHVFISADYSQIELVVLAHLSQDKNLISAFNNNEDIHKKTAALLMNIDENKVSQEERRIAKSINFGIIYGMSGFRLANEIGIPRAMANQFIENYFAQFSGVTKFIEDTEINTTKTGYTQTILGHRRDIPTINSRNKTLANAAKRMAVNTCIQGSAADIVKLAMCSVDKTLRKQKLQSHLILQIHDELLLECPKEEQKQVADIVKTCMQNAYKLSVPLRVSLNIAKNWGMLK